MAIKTTRPISKFLNNLVCLEITTVTKTAITGRYGRINLPQSVLGVKSQIRRAKSEYKNNSFGYCLTLLKIKGKTIKYMGLKGSFDVANNRIRSNGFGITILWRGSK